MKIESSRMPGLRAAAIVVVTLVAVGLAGCADDASSVDRAQAQVTAKEKALTEAEADLTAASGAFCEASETYIVALDRYGDVLNDTAPTVGDVTAAGADLAEPREERLRRRRGRRRSPAGALVAEQELVDARRRWPGRGRPVRHARRRRAPSEPTATPLAPAATVDRVKQAESEFARRRERSPTRRRWRMHPSSSTAPRSRSRWRGCGCSSTPAASPTSSSSRPRRR